MSSERVEVGRTRRGASRTVGRRGIAVLTFACALLSLAGCSWRNDEGAATQALARTQGPLAWTVNRAQATHRLATASMQGRDAAPGYQFVVLDVSVRNRDAGPQVLAEGTLVAMDESRLQTFDRPVTVLSDDYLSLQVLAPAQTLRGKIAYEVPEHLPGVLYWNPGNGSERILLNVVSAPAPRTLANVDDVVAERGASPDATPIASADARQTNAIELPTTSTAREPAPESDRVVVASTPPAPPHAKATTSVVAVQSPRRQVATIAVPRATVPRPTVIHPPVSATPSGAEVAPPQIDPEQARRLACEGLVSRNDPAEKEHSLEFFAQACRDYALPEHWRPQPAGRKSLVERASELLARMVVKPQVVRISNCGGNATSRADALVCGDPDLSAMDHQLAQSVARASDHVDDPVALQREQDDWRGRVRNACDTTDCLEHVYGQRIAQVDALVPVRP